MLVTSVRPFVLTENRILRLRILIVCFLWPAAVLGDSHHEDWSTIGDWTILIDESAGRGCFMQKDFDNGIRIRIGYYPKRGGGFLSGLSKEWDHLEVGSTSIVKFIMDTEKFAGDAEVIEEGEWKGGFAFFNNPDFPTQLARRNSLEIIDPNGVRHTFGLSGTFRTLAQLEKCQSEQEPVDN